jgi:phosphoglycolate phosphatase
MFDLDGTLLDTIADLGDAMNATLDAFGFPPHDLAFYKKAVGDGAPALAERSLPPAARTPDGIRQALLRLRTEYERCWTLKTRPYEGIEPLIRELRRRHLPLAVLSNKPEAKTHDCVNHFFPESPFTIVRGAIDGIPLKPAPDAALAISQQLGIPPDRWLYVGDTDTDMQTAVRAGFFPVGAAWGFRDREELFAHGARTVIDQPAGLLELLD